MAIDVYVVGLMSGSSLDGLDQAFCHFSFSSEPGPELRQWSLVQAGTASFSDAWRERLRTLPHASGLQLAQTHVDFGHYLGELLGPFLATLPHPPDLIASHGHTVFHYPERRLTLQIGDGAALAAATGCIVIDNFRALDVALGGQGAPLAPLADLHLFPGYDFYLNLGGIANISARTQQSDRLVAFDIGGANQVLNALVEPLHLDYDDDGRIAASGRLLPDLLQTADSLAFFGQPYPKSLGNDWVQDQLLPIFKAYDASVADRLHTACVHLARQIARAVAQILEQERLTINRTFRGLITGGGAHNGFLRRCIQEECEKICSFVWVAPDPAVINYKEAALMALMGALRFLRQPNCLASATGAPFDAVGGAVHWGKREGP